MLELMMVRAVGALALLQGPSGPEEDVGGWTFYTDAGPWFLCPAGPMSWPPVPWWVTPWGTVALWVGLHSADYLLSVGVARLRNHPAVAERVSVPGSMELNPLFQRAVDRGQWLAPRFLVTLALGAVLFPAAAWLLDGVRCYGPGALAGFAMELLVGALVLTRGAVLSVHLQNLALFRRLLRVPEAAGVRLHYDFGTVVLVTRARKLEWAGLAALAVAVTGSFFFLGGLLALLWLAVLFTWWGRRRLRAEAGPSPRPEAGPPPPEARGPGHRGPRG